MRSAGTLALFCPSARLGGSLAGLPQDGDLLGLEGGWDLPLYPGVSQSHSHYHHGWGLAVSGRQQLSLRTSGGSPGASTQHHDLHGGVTPKNLPLARPTQERVRTKTVVMFSNISLAAGCREHGKTLLSARRALPCIWF